MSDRHHTGAVAQPLPQRPIAISILLPQFHGLFQVGNKRRPSSELNAPEVSRSAQDVSPLVNTPLGLRPSILYLCFPGAADAYRSWQLRPSSSQAVLSSLNKPSGPKRRCFDMIRRGSAHGLGMMATTALVGPDGCPCTILAELAEVKAEFCICLSTMGVE
ncbi:hypothetical protein BDV93DRAFT_556774 [Ceratobasidium sp. AG-I]|nr:hypothetical protein BDV93DRAFT_556774 [Ceratobasidium sp. AG-I]